MSSLVDELYKKVNDIAERLALELGQQVSMNEALLQLVKSMNLEPSDLAWSWRINQTIHKEPPQNFKS